MEIDITDRLNEAMEEHYKESTAYSFRHTSFKTLLFFLKKVKTGGDWDLKNQESWDLKPQNTYIYNGKEWAHDDIGNIHFGYVGSALFDLTTLHVGAGMYQVYSGTSKLEYITALFDDPKDREAIEYGYRIKLISNRPLPGMIEGAP